MGSRSLLGRRGIALTSAVFFSGAALFAPTAFAQDEPSAAPADAAAVAKPVPERELTPAQSGDLSGATADKCDVHWRASAVMDPSLADYANNGYGYKVAHRLYPEHTGGMEMQHWIGGHAATPVGGKYPVGPQTYFWRLPIGTTQDLEDVKLTVQLPEGFTTTAADNGGYVHLGDQEGPSRYGVGADGKPNENTVKLGNITTQGNTVTADVAEFPAGKHAVLQITQTSPAGYDATVKRPEAIADLTAVLADEDCSAEPSESSSPASEPGGTSGPGASTSAKPSTSSSKPGEPKPSTSTKKLTTTSTAKQTLKSTATTKVTSTTTTPKAAAPGASGGGSGKLPVTGAAVVPLAILAASLIGLGAMLVISKRRRNAAE